MWNKVIVMYLLVMNLAGYIICWRDKQKAIKGRYRTSEAALMTLAILGGSIGLWLSMQQYRHKTRHKKFTVGVPIIIILQAMLITVLAVYLPEIISG